MDNEFTQICKKLEHFETPEWAVQAILKKEILTPRVVDPCTGTGILADAAKQWGYEVFTADVSSWGRSDTFIQDYLEPNTKMNREVMGKTVLMNAPFSLATDFVERSFDYGAFKIVCFQRYAWYESEGREQFWEKYPPNRIYVCGSRATCWRHDIPNDQREGWIDPKTGKRRGGSSTAHAWFVWERGHPPGTLTGRIYK